MKDELIMIFSGCVYLLVHKLTLFLLLKYSLDYSLQEASCLAIFHSVSGFNNAGFILFSETDINSYLKNDYYFTWVINVLSILGSIGFWVIVDVIKNKNFQPLQLTSKIVILSTFIVIFMSGIFFFSSEYNNEKTIGDMNIPDKIHHSLFESISGRTAGFSTIDFNETNSATKFFFSGMMIIGGASGSTASGLKINTVAIIIIAVICTLKGQNRITSFKREISIQLVKKAIVICVPSILILFTLMIILMIFEPNFLFINTFFEVHSAFANVGLTTGISGKISPLGDIIIIISMFLGRIVPLAIAFLITIQNEYETFRYPNERITNGAFSLKRSARPRVNTFTDEDIIKKHCIQNTDNDTTDEEEVQNVLDYMDDVEMVGNANEL